MAYPNPIKPQSHRPRICNPNNIFRKPGKIRSSNNTNKNTNLSIPQNYGFVSL